MQSREQLYHAPSRHASDDTKRIFRACQSTRLPGGRRRECLQEKCCLEIPLVLWVTVGETDTLGTELGWKEFGIRVVNFDQISSWITKVKLDVPIRQLHQKVTKGVAVQATTFVCLFIDGWEVIDSQRKMCVSTRILRPLEKMELEVTDTQPLDGVAKVRGGDADKTEDLLVEADRFFKVFGDDADMVQCPSRHVMRSLPVERTVLAD